MAAPDERFTADYEYLYVSDFCEGRAFDVWISGDIYFYCCGFVSAQQITDLQ